MPMPDYSIRSAPQLQQQQGPLGALADFGKKKALMAGLEAAFPGSSIATEAGEAVLPTLFQKGGPVGGGQTAEALKEARALGALTREEYLKAMAHGGYMEKGGKVEKKPWWKAAAEYAWGKNREGEKSGDFLSGKGSAFTDYKAYGGPVKPMYQRMGGMTPGPLGMSDMLAAGKGKDVSKVVYKKKGGDIEDTVEIAYHAPLAPKPSGE